MAPRAPLRESQARQEIAREAARVMVDGGIQDYALAKRKALERLHLPAGTPVPGNREIEAARLEHQRLFGGDAHERHLRELREAALAAMTELEAFRPRLVGPVLAGTAGENAVVTLHLFADSAEEVGFHLMERGIPFRDTEQRLRMSTGEMERVPCYAFLAGDVAMELLVFSGRTRRHTPLSPVDGRAMRRAAPPEVQSLLAPAVPVP